MEIVNFRKNFSPQNPVIVTIGNFDGVHLGHQSIIRKVVEEAKQRQCFSVLITFDPHPQEIIHPQETVKKICTPELRIRLLEKTGLDSVHIIRFTPELSQLSPDDFILHFLIERFNLVKVVIGYDFHFGKNRMGDSGLLKRYSEQYNFDLEKITAIEIGDNTVSSTFIRQLIEDNCFEQIPKYLGRLYSIRATVQKGEQRGRTLGFPTANLRPEIKIPLTNGVYVTEVAVNEQKYHGVTNVGIRPTFGHQEQTIETYIFDFSDDIYGTTLEIWPLKQLRKEKKFSGMDALQQQIEVDVENAKSYLQSRPSP
ncbi:MAG: bifunctional riboflavin kinase/FAD synthetase [SAR324 cluster bacterium]|nr:bifunctional riboflavin kinase/FAD synthetase [SAR324 cluster bacterium]